MVKGVLPAHVSLEQVDVWFQDESRVGQQGSQTRIWAKRGTRPGIVKQQQFLSLYIYGAVCPSQGSCAALVVPHVNQEGLQKHLEEISAHIPQGRHAVVVMDQAGWHHTKNLALPKNLSILHLPPYSPELNPQEQVWQYLKDHYLANRVFQNYTDILDACCNAWSLFASIPSLLSSLTARNWTQLI